MADETRILLMDDETLEDVGALLRQRHEGKLAIGETLRLELWGEDGTPRAAYATLLLHNEDESLYYPMEARVLLAAEGAGVPGPDEAGLQRVVGLAEAGKLLVDVLDYYLGEYLNGDRDVYLTIDWSDLRFGDVAVQARGQVLNRKLERMADELLRQAEEAGGGEG